MQAVNGHILIVEDDALVALSYKDVLEEQNYTCEIVHTVRDARGKLKGEHCPYKLILCDHDLPDGKGTDILRQIDKQDIQTPVLYMSAATPEILNKVSSLQSVKKVLCKPIDNKQLIEQLSGAVYDPEVKQVIRFIERDERKMLLEVAAICQK